MNKEVAIPQRGFTKEVWFIHGANASVTSFNHLKESIRIDPDFNHIKMVDVSYDCQEKLPQVVQALSLSLPSSIPTYIVGHSLGGILAVAVSQRAKHFELPCNIRGIFTLASPFGGSESADYLRWLYPNYYLFKSISTQNRMITDLKAVGAIVPTLSLVTSSGNNPLIPAANDGIVTIASQRALPGAKYIEVPYNHFEVLLAKETTDHLKIFLTQK